MPPLPDPFGTIAAPAIHATRDALITQTAAWPVAHLAATLADALPAWATEVGLDATAVTTWLATLAASRPEDAAYRAALIEGWARLLVLETTADLGA